MSYASIYLPLRSTAVELRLPLVGHLYKASLTTPNSPRMATSHIMQFFLTPSLPSTCLLSQLTTAEPRQLWHTPCFKSKQRTPAAEHQPPDGTTQPTPSQGGRCTKNRRLPPDARPRVTPAEDARTDRDWVESRVPNFSRQISFPPKPGRQSLPLSGGPFFFLGCELRPSTNSILPRITSTFRRAGARIMAV
jgi:hypothetical protein